MVPWLLHQRAQPTQAQLSVSVCLSFLHSLHASNHFYPWELCKDAEFSGLDFSPSDCTLCILFGSRAQRGWEERKEKAGPGRRLRKPGERRSLVRTVCSFPVSSQPSPLINHMCAPHTHNFSPRSAFSWAFLGCRFLGPTPAPAIVRGSSGLP